MRSLVVISTLSVFAAAASAQVQPGFWLTGYPAGGMRGAVTSISQDGAVAAGWTQIGLSSSTPGFLWTRDGGRYDFGLNPGMPIGTMVRGVSSDGSVVVGEAGQAFRWAGSGPVQFLGVLPGEQRSYGEGVSGDGSVAIGWCEHSTSPNAFGQAFRWTESGGMQGLGYTPGATITEAFGISRDGSTIVGVGAVYAGPTDAFVWTQAGGMQVLPQLPGAPFRNSFARAASADGSVIVGFGPASSGLNHALRWTASGVEDLGLPVGFAGSYAYAVNDNGTVVGGVMNSFSTTRATAMVWTEQQGINELSDYLSAFGVSVPNGYELSVVNAISGDGLTFGGVARNLMTNVNEGFVATVPPPPSLLVLLLPALARRRRSRA